MARSSPTKTRLTMVVHLKPGYEVFDKQEVTKEHNRTSHEPVTAWMDRPTTGGSVLRQTKEGFNKGGKRIPSINKTQGT